MKNFWKSAALCLGAIAMVACTQKETITPSFPQQVVTDNDMTATKTVEFEANQDWELTVPQSTISYFWIEGNGGNRLNKMAGKAGSYKIKIGVSDEADFDKDIVCDVTLKMGGESKVIATLTLKKAEKVVKTYACKVNDGKFAYKQEGGFDFDTTAVATTVTLIEDATYGYSMPVLFDAGFAYELEGPEWLAVAQMSGVDLGKRGQSGVVLEANLNKMTSLEKGTLKFKVRNSDEVVATLDVQMPDLSSFMEVKYDNGEFDKDGKYNFFDQTSDSLIINVTHVDRSLVFALAGLDDGNYWSASCHSDFTYPFGVINVKTDASSLFCKTRIAVAMLPNTGEDRNAYVLAIPQARLNFVSGDDTPKFNQWIGNAGPGEAFSEDFEDCVLAKVLQKGAPKEPVVTSMFKVEEGNATIESMPTTHASYLLLSGGLGLTDDKLFVATSTGKFGLSSTADIWNFKFYEEPLMESVGNGVVSTKLQLGMSMSGTYFTFEAAEDVKGLLVATTGESEDMVAAIYVDYKAAAGGATDMISFAYPELVQGATLEKYEGMSPIGMAGVPHYKLTYTQEYPMMAMINVPAAPLWGASYYNESSSPTWWLTYEQMDEAGKQIMVNMSQAGETDCFLFGSGISSVDCVLICTRQ